MASATKTAYVVRCVDAGVDCPFELQIENLDEGILIGLEHLYRVHGMKPSEETLRYALSAFREKTWSR